MDAIQVKKAVIFTVRTCYRSVYKHPFFVGMAFFLFFMHRSFPFMFYFLVSASPVLVSTAVLLGTLLSFGQPNIPEIEQGEINHEIASLRTGGGLDHTVVERDGSCRIKRYSESRSDMDKSVEEVSSSLTANDISDVGKNDGFAEPAPLKVENSSEFPFEKWETHGENDSCDVVFGRKDEMRENEGEVLVNVYPPVQRAVDEYDNAKLFEAYVGAVGAETVDRSSLLGSPRRHEDEEKEEDDDDDDDASDFESDGDESSSPDASMADIIPLLDELHPLLDIDVPQLARASLEGSGSTSESSSGSSSDEDNELDDDIENHEDDLEVVDDEEEREGHADNIDEDKSAIRWTEVDQKNLMDLGTSELERNKRLESLIARRRLRKSMKMMTERNLIDFDSADLPFSIAHISTARRNPFDLPYDDDMGLPPIPGSAPSIMSQRRNPFDLPYDSSEEKPDLMGDDFHQDVMTLQSKEPVFRRNETFNVGPSLFGTSRHESKFKPYFIPERMTSEGTHYASFHRQSSDLSESKASSVPETESVTSDEDLEHEKPVEEDLEHENPIEEELEHKRLIEEDLVNKEELISIAEPELSSIPEHPSEHIGHGSDSYEDEDSLDPDQGKRDDVKVEYEIKLLDVENCPDMSSFFATNTAAISMEPNTNEVHLNTEALELKSQSSSPISEVNGDICAENEDELLFISEPLRGNSNEDFTILHQTSMEISNTEITRQLVDDTQHKDPVYDASPRSLDKNVSSSSVDSDLHVEKSKTSSPPSLVPNMISFTQKDYEINNTVDKVDEELVVAHHQPPSEEHMTQSEIGLPLSDQSVNEPSRRNPEGLQEPTKLIDLNFQELDSIHQDIEPPKTFESTSMLSEAKEIEAPGADLNDDILDRVEFDEIIHVLERDTFPNEADTTTGNMDDSVEDLDDIEEIDEGLLHELDTVGDFSIKDSESDYIISGGESFHMMHYVSNSFENLKNDDAYSGVTLGDEQNLRASGVEKEPSNSEEEMGEALAFQISKMNYGKRLNSLDREIVHVEAVNQLDSERTNDRPLPEENAIELADLNMMQNPNAREIDSGIPVVEVQAIHDNEFSYKEAEPMSEKLYDGFGKSKILPQDPLHVKTEVGMPILEEHSLDDIRLALAHVDAKGSEKQNAVDLVQTELSPCETLDEYPQHKIVHDGSVLPESNSNLTLLNSKINDENPALELQQDPLHAETEVVMPLLEPSSLGDIESDMDQVDGTDSEKHYALKLVNAELSPDETVGEYFQHEMLHEGLVPPENKSDITAIASKLVQDSQSAVAQQYGESVDRLITHGSNGDDLDSAESHDPLEILSSTHVDKARSNDDIIEAIVHVSTASIKKLPIANSEIESADLMVNEVHSSKAIKSSSEVSGVVEASSKTAERLPKEVETTKDSKESVVQHKMTKSGNSSSSSSSTSSDSTENDK